MKTRLYSSVSIEAGGQQRFRAKADLTREQLLAWGVKGKSHRGDSAVRMINYENNWMLRGADGRTASDAAFCVNYDRFVFAL